jgi:hypothetical protein
MLHIYLVGIYSAERNKSNCSATTFRPIAFRWPPSLV